VGEKAAGRDGQDRRFQEVGMARAQSRGQNAEHMAEVAEFALAGQSFGINGSKIKQLVPLAEVEITKPPYNHPSVSGVFLFRGHTVPLISLNTYLDLSQPQEENERQVVVVTEFNEMTTAFVADQVNRIHRKAWNEFKPLDAFMASRAPQILGSITIEEREILVLDLEHIVGEIFPSTISNYDEASFQEQPRLEDRGEVLVFFAEDSRIIRTQLCKVLASLGYTQVRPFENGLSCLRAVEQAVQEPEGDGGRPGLIITDIEMPQMDGMQLCEKVKKEMGLPVPVIMFSSLINEQTAKKCEAVGADASVSKPQTDRLVELMDGLCLGEAGAS
jgi:two-component system chemotaxis response regulator CheV